LYKNDREFADGQYQTVGGFGAAELVQVGIEPFGLAAQIDRLAEEGPRHRIVRRRFADLVGFAADEACHTGCIAETEVLVYLRVVRWSRSFGQVPGRIS
jgi:hypothetical protein